MTQNRAWVTDMYGVPPQWQSLILSAADGSSVLTPPGVAAMFDLEGKVGPATHSSPRHRYAL